MPDINNILKETAKAIVQKQIEISPINGSLAEALQKAEENSVIILSPGKYELSAPLVLDQNVTIRGTSSEEVTIKCASGDCVLGIAGHSPKLENLTIDYCGDLSFGCGIRASDGNPVIKNCKFISKTGGGLCLIGQNLHTEVISCVISECGATGIIGGKGAVALFTGCLINKNRRSITVAVDARFTFQDCHILDSREHGIGIRWNGFGEFQNCTIIRSKGHSVYAGEGGEVVMTRCRISDGETCGVLIEKNGKGIFHDNTLENNINSGIELNWAIAPDAGSVTGSGNTPPIPKTAKP